MTDTQEQLVRSLGRLRLTHDRLYDDLCARIDRGEFFPDTDPEDIRDQHGMPMLAQLQVALVQGYAALVTAEAHS